VLSPSFFRSPKTYAEDNFDSSPNVRSYSPRVTSGGMIVDRVAVDPLLHRVKSLWPLSWSRLGALAWRAGARLDIRVIGGLITVTTSDEGAFSATIHGHLRLPATVRHFCGVEPGDRVLLAAEPVDGVLAVYSPAVMDSMLALTHAQAMGGDAWLCPHLSLVGNCHG
jgi:hypothetical protein